MEFDLEQSDPRTDQHGRPVVGLAQGKLTLVHYARQHASSELANLPAFTHVIGQPGQHDQTTFLALDRKARAIAAEIQSKGGAGKSVLVVLEPGVDYAAALYGCLYARAIAVPVYPPQMLRLQHTLPRLKAIIKNAEAALVIGSRATISDSQTSLWELGSEAMILVEDIDPQAAADWDGILPQSDDVAILQYTSGSTGNPRGVILKHKTLLSNLNALVKHFHFPTVKTVQWIPPYHDMGLIGGILVPVYCGCEGILLTPADFVRDPLLWLRSIQYYKGTSNGAPNFGYELCIRKIKPEDCEGLDLSNWEVAIVGAEPVRSSTLDRFARKFADFGFAANAFCPSFGLAESTLIVSGSKRGEAVRQFNVATEELDQGFIKCVQPSPNVSSKPLVGCGPVVDGLELVIVDPESHQKLPAGQIGEIWIQGSSVAAGYWNSPDATQRSFNATISGSSEAGHYLRTGDLGSLVDGELVVTGRLKELIIVNGKNLYPHDVEQVVQSTSDAFRADSGAAFSLEHEHEERLVVVQEVVRPKKFDADVLLRDVLAALSSEYQIEPHEVLLVRTGSMPKTSSGKLQRGDAKQMYLTGDFSVIASWSKGECRHADAAEFEEPQGEIESQIAQFWRELLAVQQVGRKDDFFRLGGGSLLVAQLMHQVEIELGAVLPISSLFQNSTLETFASVVSQSRTQCTNSKPIARAADSGNGFTLSSAQQRFWLLSQLGQTGAFLHVPVTLRLSGAISADELSEAFTRLIRKYAALRTGFLDLGGKPRQVIHDIAPFRVEETSFANESEWEVWRSDFANKPFDLGVPPLLRAALVRVDGDIHSLQLVFHHIVCDAGSIDLLLREMKEILEGGVVGETEDVRYVDFAHWEQDPNQIHQVAELTEYWQDRLSETFETLTLPRPDADQGSNASSITIDLPQEIFEAIKRCAADTSSTESMLFLTLFQSVLARYAATNRISIALPTTVRNRPELANCVGCFVNPIVYRGVADPNASLRSAIDQVRSDLLADLDHASVPFQNIVDSIANDRTHFDVDRMPLAQAMFLYQPSMHTIRTLGSVEVLAVEPDYRAVTAYDVSLIVHPNTETGGARLTVVCSDKVESSIATRLMNSLVACCESLVGGLSDGANVGALPILSEEDRAVIEKLEAGPVHGKADQSVVGRLEEHVKRCPNKIAIHDDSDSLTYAELDEQSNRIAAGLIASGIKAGQLVGVKLPRENSLLATLLAIWKAGAAYVPLDPELPESRLQQMLDDSGTHFVIDTGRRKELAKIDSVNHQAEIRQRSSVADESLAYVIYTSGSTGKPKGVAIGQLAITNLLESFAQTPGFNPDDKFLAITTIGFDISVLELFLPIWVGGSVQLTANRIAKDPNAIVETIRQTKPTHIQSTPSSFRMLLQFGWKPEPDMQIWCGGEPMTKDIARDLLIDGTELWNVFGPTETTVWSSIAKIESENNICIGSPIANTQFLIVDESLSRVPVGVSGELLISGHGLAHGYWNRPNLTIERFVEIDGRRYYRTGDQVVCAKDGSVRFLSRKDRQIKLNGFRVELGEVECVLQNHKAVKMSAVVNENTESGIGSLIAFVELDSSTAEDPRQDDLAGELRSFVADRLPNYMVPSIHFVEKIGTNAAGKTDYKSLPVLQKSDSSSIQKPTTPLEKQLAQLWQEVLGQKDFGTTDSFFQIGGNSLMAAQLFARLGEQMAIDLPLREIYKHPTIEMLSERIVCWQSQSNPDVLADLIQQLDELSEEEAEQALGNEPSV